MDHIPTITRGNISPALVMTIGDARADADFSVLTASDVKVQVERAGVLVVDDEVNSVTASQDGKSLTLRRAWEDGETDEAGRCWVTAYVVPWDQHFPDEGPLRLDIARAPGDA